MIRRILPLLFFIIFAGLSSCSKDDDKTVVRLKVTSNTSGIPVRVYSPFGTPLIIKDSWEGIYVATSNIASVEARCDDNTVLLTVEIYINGILKRKVFGNSIVSAVVKI